ncbi:hypothetical protein H639_07969 [Cutibacterium avidum TM16]|nr:hypothetical protein H639_07969 [Cutibacterium avidum TM16]
MADRWLAVGGTHLPIPDPGSDKLATTSRRIRDGPHPKRGSEGRRSLGILGSAMVLSSQILVLTKLVFTL